LETALGITSSSPRETTGEAGIRKSSCNDKPGKASASQDEALVDVELMGGECNGMFQRLGSARRAIGGDIRSLPRHQSGFGAIWEILHKGTYSCLHEDFVSLSFYFDQFVWEGKDSVRFFLRYTWNFSVIVVVMENRSTMGIPGS
jgi:hypothetical protein